MKPEDSTGLSPSGRHPQGHQHVDSLIRRGRGTLAADGETCRRTTRATATPGIRLLYAKSAALGEDSDGHYQGVGRFPRTLEDAEKTWSGAWPSSPDELDKWWAPGGGGQGQVCQKG